MSNEVDSFPLTAPYTAAKGDTVTCFRVRSAVIRTITFWEFDESLQDWIQIAYISCESTAQEIPCNVQLKANKLYYIEDTIREVLLNDPES